MEAVSAEVTPRRHPAAAWVEIDGEIVVYDPAAGRAHLLSGTAALLWPWLDGSATLGELVADVADVFGVEPQIAHEQVSTFVGQLSDAGLLAPVG